MVMIQIDLNENENRLVEIFRAEHGLETKEMAVKEMITRSGKCKHKYDLVEKYRVGTSPPNWKMHITQRCVYCGEIKKDVV